jgi:hypothetical protein
LNGCGTATGNAANVRRSDAAAAAEIGSEKKGYHYQSAGTEAHARSLIGSFGASGRTRQRNPVAGGSCGLRCVASAVEQQQDRGNGDNGDDYAKRHDSHDE